MDLDIFNQAKATQRPLILDGAMGSLLQQKGFSGDSKLWMTNVNKESPETIVSIHSEYIKSGADIITTNSFRTNPAAFNFDIQRSKEEVKLAVDLAKSAKSNGMVLIAGSNAPAEDCYQKERTISTNKLEINHSNHIDFLIDSDLDFILNETQSHWDEIEIICKQCYRNSIPFILSLYFQKDLVLLSGEPISDAINLAVDYGALAVGINCIAPEIFHKLLQKNIFSELWGFYLNCGAGKPEDEVIQCGISPENYLVTVQESLTNSPSFIGACCGSGFEHIRKIKDLLDG